MTTPPVTPEAWVCPAVGCTRPLSAHPVEQASRNKPSTPQTKDEKRGN
jgi:hypothetical protein